MSFWSGTKNGDEMMNIMARKKSALLTLKEIGADKPDHPLHQTYKEMAQWIEKTQKEESDE
jgi:hypothetical protein